MSDQGGISYSPARVNPFANVQVASYPEHVQVANYSQITYLNTQESEEEEEEPVDQEYEPAYDVNEEPFEPPALHRSPPAISSPTISSPPVTLPKAKKEKVKSPTPKEATPVKQPSKPLTTQQKKQAKKREREKAKKKTKNETKMTPNTESSEPPPLPASEVIPAEPSPVEANKSEDAAPSPQPTDSSSSKPPEPSEPPEPPEQPNEHEAAEVTDKQVGEAETTSPVESESIPSGEQSNEQETREPASETAPEVEVSESPQLEKSEVAAGTHPISTTDSDTPADIQEPNAPAPSTEESKLDTSEQDPKVASEANGELPDEKNDQETTATTDAGAVSESQAGEAADEPAAEPDNPEPEKLEDVHEDNSKEESSDSQDAAHESASNSEPNPAVAVETNEPPGELSADAKPVQESDETEQPAEAQKAETVEGVNETLPDGNPTNSTGENLENPEGPQDPKTEPNDENTATGEEALPPNNKDELSGETIKQDVTSDPEPSEVAPESPNAPQLEETTPATAEPVTEPQEQINNSEVTELPGAKDDESQAVADPEDAANLKETDNTNSVDTPAKLPSESESATQADGPTEEHPGDSAAVESQEQAEQSGQVANIPDPVAVDVPEVPAIQSNDDAEKLPEAGSEPTEGPEDPKIPDEAVPEPIEDTNDVSNVESAPGESVKPQEPEIALGSEAKEEPIIPEQTATESLSATESPVNIPAAEAVPAQDEPASQEPVPENSAPEAPIPAEPVSEEPASQEPTSGGDGLEEPISSNSDSQDTVSQETATKETVGEEPSPQESTSQEAAPKELVTEDPAPQEPTTPVSEDQVLQETAPEESISQDTPQENTSQELVSKEPTPEESVPQEAIPNETISEDLVSEEAVKDSTQDSDSQKLGSEQTVPPEPVSEESASQEPILQEAVPEELAENPAPQKLSAEDLVPQGSDPQETVIKESISQENDPQDAVSQDPVPPKNTSQEPAPQESVSDDSNPPQEPNLQGEIPVASQDDIKGLPETSPEESEQPTDPEPISESAPVSTDEPIQESAQEITPSEQPITNEDNSLKSLPADSDDKNLTDASNSLSEDEFVIVDKTDGEGNQIMDSPEQRERLNDAKLNDSSQPNPGEEHQIITPNETTSQDHQGEGESSSPSDESQELPENGDDDASDSAQPHDSNSSSAEADTTKPVEPSLSEDTTPSQVGEEHEQEVEKQEPDQQASILAEQKVESHDGVETPKDEEKTPQEPAPEVINDQTADVNAELSEPQADSDSQSTGIKEKEKPIDPSASGPEVIIESEDPVPKEDLTEPPPDVGKEGVEGEASIEHGPDDGVTQPTPPNEAVLNDQGAPKSEAPVLNDVSPGQSESDLTETTLSAEAESCPIVLTEPESSQQMEDKQESGSQPDLETGSPPKLLPEDPVEVPASSPETEKQLDQTSLPRNESDGEKIPQEATNLGETNGEEEKISGETYSPDQPTEPVSVDPETEKHGDLQSTLPSDPGQEEQLDSKSSPILEEAEQPDENEKPEEAGENSTEEQDKAHEIPRETLEPVEILSAISQDQTNLDQTEPDAPILSEPKELISQAPTHNSQGPETEDKGEEVIDKAQEQEPAPSPLPTESLTDPLQPSIHENGESQVVTPSESVLAQETKSEQNLDSHEGASSESSQIPPDHKQAVIEEPEPEPTPNEVIQGGSAIPEKANTESQTVSDEHNFVEQTSVTPVDDQASVEIQDSQDHVSVDPISTKEQATVEDQPKEEMPTELPMLIQPQENEVKETTDNNSPAVPEEPAIELADKVDKEPEASEPIQEEALAESQVPVDQMPTEDQPVEDKPTEDTPTEDQISAGGQFPIESQAPIEDKEVIEHDTPIAPSTLEDHSSDATPVAVDFPTEQLPDQPPESDLQEPQDHKVETTEPSDTSNELDEEPIVSEPAEGQTPDEPVSEPIGKANAEQTVGEETKGELLSTAVVLDKPQENELDEVTGPEDKSIPEEPEVIHIQDNQNEEPNTSLPDSATGGQVSPQEAELSSESIVPSQPQENKDAEATGPGDKAVSGEPEAVHIQDGQSGEPDSNPSDPPTQDRTPSPEPNPADQISIKSDDKTEISPNTSSGDTTQPITMDSEPPVDDGSTQLRTQDSEEHAPDKDVNGPEEGEITREVPSVPISSPQLLENNDDKAVNGAQTEPGQAQPTESSEPVRADVIADIKETTTHEDPTHGPDETLNLKDTPSPEAAGNDSPTVAEDLEPPSDKTDQSIDATQPEAKNAPIAKPEEAENISKQPHSETAVSDQSQRIQENATSLGIKPVLEEPLSDTIAPDQTQENEEATRNLDGKAAQVEHVINDKPEPIRAPKENTRAVEEIKVKKIRSDDESKDTVGPIPTDGGPVRKASKDDEEKKSADERHHRPRRHHHHHHHHHHHSSRSKDIKSSGEHLQPRNTRIESSNSIKSSSDRSIPQTPKRDSGFSVDSSRATDSSNHRRRTPEEQAAHERRKEERRAAREAYDRMRENKGKDSEAPPSDRHSSHRSSRRHSISHSERSHTERRSERSQPEKYSERSQPEKYSERSFSERYSERPQSERYSERSHSERHPAKESASSSNKRFFDMRHGESSLASNYVPRTRSNSTNVPPPVFKEPSKSSGLLRRTTTGKSSRSHRESGEIPRPRSHRSHDRDHDQAQDDSPKRRRSEAKISGSLESTSSKTTPPSPTKDEHRQLRQKERQKAREATEAAEAKKKSGGIRAAFKKLFS